MMGLWPLAGAVVGALNSLARWWTVDRLRPDMPRSALTLALGGMILRLALVAALLIGGLKHGIIPGMLAFGGLWVTRLLAVTWMQSLGVLWTTSSAAEGHRGTAKT